MVLEVCTECSRSKGKIHQIPLGSGEESQGPLGKADVFWKLELYKVRGVLQLIYNNSSTYYVNWRNAHLSSLYREKLSRAVRNKQNTLINLPNLPVAVYTLKPGLGLETSFLRCSMKIILAPKIFLSLIYQQSFEGYLASITCQPPL